MIPLKIGGAITILIHLNKLSFLFYFFFVLSFVCFNVLYDMKLIQLSEIAVTDPFVK